MIMGVKTPELRRVAQYCCTYNVDQNVPAYIIKYLSSLIVLMSLSFYLKTLRHRLSFQQECSTLLTHAASQLKLIKFNSFPDVRWCLLGKFKRAPIVKF